MMISALALLAAPPQVSASLEPPPSRPAVSARGRASVKIVRPFRLRVGREEDAEGARWRSTHIRDRAGRAQPARLVEFE